MRRRLEFRAGDQFDVVRTFTLDGATESYAFGQVPQRHLGTMNTQVASATRSRAITLAQESLSPSRQRLARAVGNVTVTY
jgi:hypothetical protein